MKHFKAALLFIFILSSLQSFCQANEQVEMADVLRRDGKIYTVRFGLVVILTAMIVLLLRVDGKLFQFEKEIKK